MASFADKERTLETWTDAVTIYDDIRARCGSYRVSDLFTAHVFTCVLTVGVVEARSGQRSVADVVGLGRGALSPLISAWAPGAARYIDLASQPERIFFDEEEQQLCSLFDRHRCDDSFETAWIGAILTRRSMSPRHLWQDLGLASRDELGRLMRERFPGLAERNAQNMKWKKFFYRSLCELEGFTLCTAPTCRQCSDFESCFGDEKGESLLAKARVLYGDPVYETFKAPPLEFE